MASSDELDDDIDAEPVSLKGGAASNAVTVEVQFLHYCKLHLKDTILWSVPMLFCVIVGFLGFPLFAAFWLAVPILIVIAVKKRNSVCGFFRNADANPGVVVSVDPLLIAVATDLRVSSDVGTYPAVAIIEAKLPSIDGQPPKIGMKVPTVCWYASPFADDPDHWSSFEPWPVQYATANQKDIERVLKVCSQEQWRLLQSSLKKIPKPYQSGLYYVWELEDVEGERPRSPTTKKKDTKSAKSSDRMKTREVAEALFDGLDESATRAEAMKRNVKLVASDDPEMERAWKKARATLPQFVEALSEEANGDSEFFVKKRFDEDGQSEHLWLSNIRVKGRQFVGIVGNDPQVVTNVQAGDRASVAFDEISDWMIQTGDEIQGGFTSQVLMKRQRSQ